MAMTFDALKGLLEEEQLNYFVHPKAPMAMFGLNGKNGPLRLSISLQMEGDFLQFSSVDYARCTPDSPHLSAVLRLLSDLNMGLRWIKWCWDPRNGEILVNGDFWVMDNPPTHVQFRRMLENIIPSLDEKQPRLLEVIRTGIDPTLSSPTQAAKEPATVDTL